MTTPQHISDIRRRLTNKAVDHNGTLIVRSVDVARIIGINRRSVEAWIKYGTARSVRFNCKPRRRATVGVVVCIYLEDALRHASQHRPYQRWTVQQIELLKNMLADCKSFAEISTQTGKTRYAIIHKINHLGIDIAAAADLYTVKQLTDLLGVSTDRINGWVYQLGLRVRRHDARPRKHLIDLDDLVRFIRKHPWVWLDDAKRCELARLTGKPVPHRKRGAA